MSDQVAFSQYTTTWKYNFVVETARFLFENMQDFYYISSVNLGFRYNISTIDFKTKLSDFYTPLQTSAHI